jgi:hypothetical protein
MQARGGTALRITSCLATSEGQTILQTFVRHTRRATLAPKGRSRTKSELQTARLALPL